MDESSSTARLSLALSRNHSEGSPRNTPNTRKAEEITPVFCVGGGTHLLVKRPRSAICPKVFLSCDSSDYSQTKTNMLISMLGGNRTFYHKGTKIQRKGTKGWAEPLCLCAFVVKFGIGLAAQPLFPGAVREKARTTLSEKDVLLRACSRSSQDTPSH